MSNLLKFYTDAIGIADLIADDKGNISGGVFSGELRDATIDGRRLILPTYENLRRTDTTNFINFHPLKENVIRRGESKVMLAIRSWSTRRAFTTMAALLTETLTLALDNSKHTRLSPDQASFIKCLGDVDATSLRNLVDILASCTKSTATHAGVAIFVRRPGPRIGVESRRVRRVATMNFPLYERIAELYEQDFGDKIKLPKGQKHVREKRTVNDVEIRKSDVALFKVLFELVINNIAVKEHWVCETDSDIGPTFVSLLMTVRKFAEVANSVAQLFENVFGDAEQIKYNLEWSTTLNDINSLAAEVDHIPMQDGNDGAVAEENTGIPSVSSDARIESPKTQIAQQPAISTNQTVAKPQVAATSVASNVEQPKVIVPENRPRLPPVAVPMTNQQHHQQQLGLSVAMNPMFNGGQMQQPAKESLYGGNRLKGLDELHAEEQRANIQRMLEQRERGMQAFQQNQAQAQQQQMPGMLTPNQPVQGVQTQIVHNGVVYQAVAPVSNTGVMQNGTMPNVLGNRIPNNGPITLNHLVPVNNGMNGMFPGMMGMQPMAGRNAPIFGQTVMGGNPMMMNNMGGMTRLM